MNTDRIDVHHVLLSEIVGRRDLDLTLVVAAGDPPITWATASELVEPAVYLRGGELLLTAGVNLPETVEGTRDYVASLVSVGVGALGFGVAPVHEAVPEPLVDQCREQGLPLLRIPRTTSFSAVGRAVGEELSERHLRVLRGISESHQALARAVTAPDPVERLLRVLAGALGGWVVLAPTGPDARVRRTDGAPTAFPDDLRSLIVRLTTPGGPRSAKAELGADEVFLHTVGPPPEERGVVMVGRPTPLDITDRAVLRTATALLELLFRAGGEGPPDPALPLVALLLDGGLDTRSSTVLAGLTDTRARSGHDTARPSTGERGTAYRVLRASPASDGGPAAATDPTWGTHLVDRPAPDAADEVARAILSDRGARAHREHLDLLRSQGWVGALSPAVAAAELPEADRDAASLLVRARALGEPLLYPTEGDDPFDALLSSAEAARAGRAILGPLARDTDTARALRATLHAWLARHGNWDRTAGDLGVHRNSVRHRIGRIERDLGVDLADPEHRMRLWFALTRGHAGEPPGSVAGSGHPSTGSDGPPRGRDAPSAG